MIVLKACESTSNTVAWNLTQPPCARYGAISIGSAAVSIALFALKLRGQPRRFGLRWRNLAFARRSRDCTTEF